MQDQLQTIKQRFGIIGNEEGLNRSLTKALRVAATEISVLVIGESGVGKEFIPKIIHAQSARKHNAYIAVNCGAIPEGTIDSELFGHEKGSFTGATAARKGYFEVADGGTIFLDEVGELPLATQVRLLRVLETGEFIKVGSSQAQKTNVRVVAATNVNVIQAVRDGKFREDLYYRLNTVQIDIPPLRDRPQDISLLFRKFASDFAEKYHMPILRLLPDAQNYLMQYPWPGNIRQLRNFVEQISVMETKKEVDVEGIKRYLPEPNHLPILAKRTNEKGGLGNGEERELLYKFLFDMKKDLNDLRKLTLELIGKSDKQPEMNAELIRRVQKSYDAPIAEALPLHEEITAEERQEFEQFDDFEYAEIEDENESLSLQDQEKELITKALERNKGKRKYAAEELGISERTLYRKIKQYDL